MNRGNHVANLYRFVIAVWRAKERNAGRVKYWEILTLVPPSDAPDTTKPTKSHKDET
jgi:hypothetical protein